MVTKTIDSWEEAKAETARRVGMESSPITSTRAQVEDLRAATRDGRIVLDEMDFPERRGVEEGLKVLALAEQYDREIESMKSEGGLGDTPKSSAFSTGPIVEEAFSNENYEVDTRAYHPSEFRAKGNKRPEDKKYSGPILKSAILDAALNGTPIVEAVQASTQAYHETGDEETSLRAQTNVIVQEQKDDVQQSLENIDLFRPTEDIQADLEALKADIKYLDDQGKNPDYVFWTTVSNPEVKEEAIKRFAIDDQVRDLINSTFEGMGIVDWARNIGGVFLPGKDAFDNYRLTGSAFNAEKYIDNLIENFKSLPADKQQEILPGIIEWAKNGLPELRQVEFYNALASADYQKDTAGFNWFYAGLSAVDFAGFAAPIAIAGVSINRTRKAAKALKEAGREDLASDIVATTLVSGSDEAKAIAEMDDISLVNTAMPFKTEYLDSNSVDGVSRGVAERVGEFELAVAKNTELVNSGEARLVEKAFTDKEIAELERNKRLDFMDKNGIEDAEIIERSDLGFTLQYEAFDEDGVSLGLSTQEFTHTLSDKSHISMNPVGMISRWIASPLTFLKGTEGRALVKQAERLDNQQAKLLNEFRGLQREAVSSIIGKRGAGGLSPFARKKMEELDHVLLKGDQEKTVYTLDQLKDGSLGVTFTDDQVEAYYKTRSLMDSLLDIREHAAKREALLRGEAGVTIKGREMVGKPLRDMNEAQGSINDSGRKQIFIDDEEGTGVLDIEGVNLKGYYDEGWSVVRLKEPTAFAGSDNKVFYAMVQNDNIGDLPRNMLPRRTGYIPKINNGVAYFVKEMSSHIVDGTPISAMDTRANPRTMRAFARREEAENYAQELRKKAEAAGKTQDDVIYRALEDRQLEQEAALSTMGEEHALSRPGGLFSGARSEELLYGVDGLEINRVDSFTAISHNLSNLAKYVSRNEWRLGMEKMAVETANAMQGSGNRVYRSFDDLVKAPMGTESGRKIRALHSQIDDWMSWPSSEEMAFKYSVQKIIDSSIGGKLPRGALNVLFDLKNTDPTAAMRASAFHGLLGWFNPVQLWVQAQGAAVAMSMNIFKPAALAKSFRDQSFLQFLGHTQGTPEMIAKAAKSLGMDKADALAMHKAWKKTGLEDSVLVTADHAAASRGRGVAMDAVSRAADSGLFFYKSGELFNRRLSFATAYREIHKGGELTDEVLKQILDRANDYMFNMGKANRAAWQKGIFGVGTQFQQVSAKTVENLLGLNGNFTRGERGKILLGQGLLYGSAGVPLGTWGSQMLMEAYGVKTQEDLEKRVGPEAVKLVNEGVLGWMSLVALGIDINIGERSSYIDGVESLTEDVLFGEGTLAGNLLGAFTGPAGEFWKGFVGEYEPLSLGMAEDRPIDYVKALANPFLASVRTFRNADKAYFMNQYHKVVDRNFNTVLNGPFNITEELAVAAGFTLNREVTTRSLTEANEVKASYRKSVVNAVVRINYQAALWANAGELTPERRQLVAEGIAVYMQTLDNQYERTKAREAIFNKLKDGKKSKEAQAWHTYLRTHSENTINNAIDLQRVVKGKFSSLQNELGGQALHRQGVYDNQESE